MCFCMRMHVCMCVYVCIDDNNELLTKVHHAFYPDSEFLIITNLTTPHKHDLNLFVH